MSDLYRVNVTNILQVTPHELNDYINRYVLNVELPRHTPNSEVWADQCLRLLPYFAQWSAWCAQMYNLVYTAVNDSKKLKKAKDDKFSEDYYIDLDSKRETLYRSMQALDRLYESTSRILTGIGQANPRASRHE